jgi:hypothetical protein
MMIRRSMAKQRGKNRPVAVPQQADHLIIQAIYRRFTGTRPSICRALLGAQSALPWPPETQSPAAVAGHAGRVTDRRIKKTDLGQARDRRAIPTVDFLLHRFGAPVKKMAVKTQD